MRACAWRINHAHLNSSGTTQICLRRARRAERHSLKWKSLRHKFVSRVAVQCDGVVRAEAEPKLKFPYLGSETLRVRSHCVSQRARVLCLRFGVHASVQTQLWQGREGLTRPTMWARFVRSGIGDTPLRRSACSSAREHHIKQPDSPVETVLMGTCRIVCSAVA